MNSSFSTLKNKADEAVGAWAETRTAGGEEGEAARYAVRGGKRLRPVMLLSAAEIAGGDVGKAIPFAVAIELIHSYSLVHDDMPCMDDDDLRRGEPTVHKKFGEWRALLTGDALLNSAYEILLENVSDEKSLRAARIIADCAGANGMIRGQYLDLSRSDDLENLFFHKTGKLFVGALTAGAALFCDDEKIIESLAEFGRHFGAAFQIFDDFDDFDKGVADGDINFAAKFGVKKAKSAFSEHLDAANEAISGFAEKGVLPELSGFLKI